MALQILCIGDVGNYIKTLSKFSKSRIHIINWPKADAGNFTYDDEYELFENYKVSDQVKKINSIKHNFDLCIVMGTGERIAYLCDLNYVCYYVGRDIDAPRFKKNSSEPWFSEPLHQLNIFERNFYKKTFESAIAHVAPIWVFDHLKKYTKSGIKMDRKPVDSKVFNDEIKPLEIPKKKFTFFCPQRMGIPKGTDILWNALKFCKSDFEILQVDWRDMGTKEEQETSLKIRESRPKQVRLIPMIKRNEMPRYYKWSDAVIGNLRIGSYEYVEMEAVFSKKPVINFADPKIEIILDDKKINSPFLPKDNDPKTIAALIDKIVESKEFRDELWKSEFNIVKEITDPHKAAEWWDELFEKFAKKHKMTKNTPKILLKFRLWSFLISNRLYLKKLFRN
tara:strand:+ start:834 stop:2015 length:1182 start_codon:yes stop_codon:yes gene_type:complete